MSEDILDLPGILNKVLRQTSNLCMPLESIRVIILVFEKRYEIQTRAFPECSSDTIDVHLYQ